jgi:hypothetical protein
LDFFVVQAVGAKYSKRDESLQSKKAKTLAGVLAFRGFEGHEEISVHFSLLLSQM